MSVQQVSKYRGPVFILLASLCFSTTGTTQALAPDGASPLVIGGIRLWLGCVFLFIWCQLSNRLPNWREMPKGRTVIAALGILCYQLIFFAAVAATGVAVGTVVTCGAAAIITGLLGFVFLRETPRRIWYLATLASIVGLALLSFSDNIEVKPLGLVLAVLSGGCYGVYAVFGKSLVLKFDPSAVIFTLFTVGAVLVTPVFFIYPTAWMFTWPGAATCLYLGLVTAACGYALYLTGLKTTPASTAATINLSESIAAACWGLLILGEQLTPLHALGILLVFGATALLTLKPRG